MADDRLQVLLSQTAITGIDYVKVETVEVAPDPVFYRLTVHFFVDPSALDAGALALTDAQVSLRSTSERSTQPVIRFTQSLVGSVLRIDCADRPDFTLYDLTLDDPRIDRFFRSAIINFQADCPSLLDCKPPDPECEPDPIDDYAPDYRARDFWSLRSALLDMASLRHPHWTDRLAADVGVMLAEVMASLGDETAYLQDRIAREAHLATASQRRTARRHLRLVDYHLADGLGATTWLQFTVSAVSVSLPVHDPDPTTRQVWAESDDGSQVVFEVGRGLHDPESSHVVKAEWNEYEPHIWDQNATCLGRGATEMHILGHHAASLLPGAASKWILIRSNPEDASVAKRAWMVELVDAEDQVDPLFLDALLNPTAITRLRWTDATALPWDLPLEAVTVHGNMVPATAGRTLPELPELGPVKASFVIGESSDPDVPEAVERTGPGDSVVYRHSLAETDGEHLVWLLDDNDDALPELRLYEIDPTTGILSNEWSWTRGFVGSPSSLPSDTHVALEDGQWGTVALYQRPSGDVVHTDYRSGAGFTLRFGDGEFGRVPNEGTYFKAVYRVGGGMVGNVQAETLTHFDAAAMAGVDAVTNPIAASGGVEPETVADARKVAADAFREVTFRAVRPEDYAEAVERLEDVQRAGAEFRWTGSRITAFVTPDPNDAVTVDDELRTLATQQLQRFRQVGRGTHLMDPVYAFLDVELKICIAPSAYRGQVAPAIRAAVVGDDGFFDPQNFTFGDALERSALEAAVQAVPGVRAVEGVRIRRRGHFDWMDMENAHYPVGMNELLACEDDVLYPERGTLRLELRGGA